MKDKFESIIEKIKEEDFIGEYFAAKILKEYPEIKEDFYKKYSHLEDKVKTGFFNTFSFLGKDKKLIEFSFRILDEDEDDFVKANIIKLIGEIANEDYIPRLSKFLKDEDRRIRANAVEALSKIGDRRIVDLLEPLVKEEQDNRVLANTAIALSKFEDKKEVVNDIFKKMINDPEKWMRASALYAFGETGFSEFYEFLLSSITSEDEDICRNAILALIGYSEIITKNK
ncbi:MAG: hypothetical protein C0601_00900 [Candidatus Muiribacterium halophilum]|uniref:HEAT repeat domain-containing protein n=1 Tax=Muiribacterium halophilum TaxID=2053465 RepID=A0A2N5ZM49_MUIH1|nr:MAG: hypothetical protein C0601_00900 [Candidatus Muirbacterium halophilum]